MSNNHFSVDALPIDGAVALYNLGTTLQSYSWLAKSDSDGTTYAPAGGQIAGGDSGAGGLGNPFAYQIFREPVASGGTREWCWQRGSTNLLWRIKYSPANKFTGGSPGAVRVPSAADEVVKLGGGTDASPTFAQLFDADGTYRVHRIVQSGSPYAFHMLAYLVGQGDCTAHLSSDSAISFHDAGHNGLSMTTLGVDLLNVDGVAPVVTLVSPSLGSAINRNDALVYDVTSSSDTLADVEAIVKFPSGRWEQVFDGTSFSGQYSTSSTRSAIAGGYRFSIVRTGGWVQTPTLQFRAVDTSGNLTT